MYVYNVDAALNAYCVYVAHIRCSICRGESCDLFAIEAEIFMCTTRVKCRDELGRKNERVFEGLCNLNVSAGHFHRASSDFLLKSRSHESD